MVEQVIQFNLDYAIMYWFPKKQFWIAVYNDDFDAHLNGHKISWVSFEEWHEFWRE